MKLIRTSSLFGCSIIVLTGFHSIKAMDGSQITPPDADASSVTVQTIDLRSPRGGNPIASNLFLLLERASHIRAQRLPDLIRALAAESQAFTAMVAGAVETNAPAEERGFTYELYTALIEQLIAAGQANITNPTNGLSILMHTAACGHATASRLLLQGGANRTARCQHGCTARTYAIYTGSEHSAWHQNEAVLDLLDTMPA